MIDNLLTCLCYWRIVDDFLGCPFQCFIRNRSLRTQSTTTDKIRQTKLDEKLYLRYNHFPLHGSRKTKCIWSWKLKPVKLKHSSWFSWMTWLFPRLFHEHMSRSWSECASLDSFIKEECEKAAAINATCISFYLTFVPLKKNYSGKYFNGNCELFKFFDKTASNVLKFLCFSSLLRSFQNLYCLISTKQRQIQTQRTRLTSSIH